MGLFEFSFGHFLFWGAKLSQLLKLLRRHSGFLLLLGEAMSFSMNEQKNAQNQKSVRKPTTLVVFDCSGTQRVILRQDIGRKTSSKLRRQVAQAQNTAPQGLKVELLLFLEKIRCLSQTRAFRVSPVAFQSCGFPKDMLRNSARHFLGTAAPENSNSKKNLGPQRSYIMLFRFTIKGRNKNGRRRWRSQVLLICRPKGLRSWTMGRATCIAKTMRSIADVAGVALKTCPFYWRRLPRVSDANVGNEFGSQTVFVNNTLSKTNWQKPKHHKKDTVCETHRQATLAQSSLWVVSWGDVIHGLNASNFPSLLLQMFTVSKHCERARLKCHCRQTPSLFDILSSRKWLSTGL